MGIPAARAVSMPDQLESVLYSLTQAANAQAFAQSNGIQLINGRARVVIVTRDGVDLLLDDGIVVESTYHNMVRALVPVEQLVALAKEGAVIYVRRSDISVFDVMSVHE